MRGKVNVKREQVFEPKPLSLHIQGQTGAFPGSAPRTASPYTNDLEAPTAAGTTDIRISFEPTGLERLGLMPKIFQY